MSSHFDSKSTGTPHLTGSTDPHRKALCKSLFEVSSANLEGRAEFGNNTAVIMTARAGVTQNLDKWLNDLESKFAKKVGQDRAGSYLRGRKFSDEVPPHIEFDEDGWRVRLFFEESKHTCEESCPSNVSSDGKCVIREEQTGHGLVTFGPLMELKRDGNAWTVSSDPEESTCWFTEMSVDGTSG